MKISLKSRKKIHIALFIGILITQLIILFLWFNQSTNQKEVTEVFEKVSKPNRALQYSNSAIKYYFEAENHFNNYFQEYNRNELMNYKQSLDNMSIYLDSLKTLSVKDLDFKTPVLLKKKIEVDILKLRKDLDSIIKTGFVQMDIESKLYSSLPKYSSKQVLNSFQLDTIKYTEDVAKKRMLARIGDAIAGNSDVKKEEMQIYISMLYGTKRHSGLIKDQIRNVFLNTDKYYSGEFNKLKTVYLNLREKNTALLSINKSILSKSQEIILHYFKISQYSNLKDYRSVIDKHYQLREQQHNLIFILLTLMFLITLFMFVYTFFAYNYEKELLKAKTEAELNLDLKNRLVGMLSHEMRAPLNIISNFSEKIKNSNVDKEISDSINLLHFTSNSLQLTVNQILNFFKNEKTKQNLYKSNINLKEEIQTITSSIQSLADSKKIELKTYLDDSLNCYVLADSSKIHQLFYNIIGNAIKFTDKGSITVKSKCEDTNDKKNVKLTISIADTGIGIPKDDLEHIFDKYYQSKSSSQKLSLGAGLGLNLCKEIVEMHQGEIEVKSEFNKGTEISFYLILTKTDDNNETTKAKLLNKFGDKEIKVALVDDDILMTTILKKLLTEIKCTPIIFHSANEITNYLDENDVDLIISDLQISGVSGLELVKSIKTKNNKNAKVPIIAITGDQYMETVDYKELNFDEILIKPIEREELYLKIFTVMK